MQILYNSQNINDKDEDDKYEFNLDMGRPKINYIYRIKSSIKISIMIILFCYKVFYPEFIEENPQSNIEDIFPKNYNESNEKYYAQKYFDICNNGELIGSQRFKRNLHPKFTIIIPVYNREIFITRVLRSIQNQSYKNIEILFIDDKSTDSSVEIIEENQRTDKRIKLIKHKKNEGTLRTRNDGAVSARGEFLLFVDPDDLLYEGILKKLDGATKIYDAEVIRFEAFFKHNNYIEKYDYKDTLRKNVLLTQPEILNQTFYEENGTLYQNNLFLWDKIIKKELFLRLLDNLTDYYKRQHWTLYEDNAIDFVLMKFINTYIFIKENGYMYCYNKRSSYSKRHKTIKINRTIKDVFLLAEIVFDYTDDNEYEKQMAMFQLKRLKREYKNSLEKATEGFDYYYRTLHKFDACKSILQRHRKYLTWIYETLQMAENNTKLELNE